MPKTRVTFVVEAPSWGGAEAYVVSLVESLPAETDACVVAIEPVPSRLVHKLSDRVELRRVSPVRGKIDVVGMIRLAAAIRATRPSAVHVNANSPANNRYGILAAKLSGVPALATLHLLLPVRSVAQRLVLGVLYRSLDTVIVVSDEVQAAVVTQLGVPAERVVLVPNGVRPRSAIERMDEDRPARRVVGVLARLVRHKGLDVLIEAVRQLAADGVPLELHVGGVGPEDGALQRQATGVPVVFDGEIIDVDDWLSRLDMFCLPSRAEGLPLALLEAMMSGLACVATDVGQISKALGSGLLLVPPDSAPALADALRRLHTDANYRRELASRGRALAVANHSIEAMATATFAIYEDRRRVRRT